MNVYHWLPTWLFQFDDARLLRLNSCRYESTSSEEDEEEDEESSSDGSEAGACSDSSVEEEAVLEDTSEEEMNINVDETDSDENMPAGAEDLKDQSEEVKEK